MFKFSRVMGVYDLNTEELDELRDTYFNQLTASEQEMISNPFNISTDTLINHFEGISFVKEDFFCNI